MRDLGSAVTETTLGQWVFSGGDRFRVSPATPKTASGSVQTEGSTGFGATVPRSLVSIGVSLGYGRTIGDSSVVNAYQATANSLGAELGRSIPIFIRGQAGFGGGTLVVERGFDPVVLGGGN
jgi:hypothetical protein